MHRRSSIASAVAALFCSGLAAAVTLGDAEIRSYLGAPLYLRIPVTAPADEVVDASCFAVIGERNLATIEKDYQLTLVETRAGRHLQLRGSANANEPVIKLNVRIGCEEATRVVREFIVLLDPAPNVVPPVAASGGTAPAANDTAQTATRPSDGRWSVYANDTMSLIAKGIYPALPAMQEQYVAALKRLNPAVSALDANAPLPVGSQLVLPDLAALSHLAARSKAAPAKRAPKPADQPAATPSPAEAVKKPAPPQTAAVPGAAAKSKPAEPTAKPAPPTPRPADSVKAAPAKTVEKPPVTAAPPTVKAPRNDGFRLRLSGAEIDMSRTRGVSEQQRAQLREKQLLLDADDQVAALLALKNTVKQLESRINEMQLKMSATTQVPAKSAAAKPVTPAASAAPVTPDTAATMKATPPVGVDSPSALPAAKPALTPTPAAVPPATTAPRPVAAKPAAPAEDWLAPDSPLVLGGGALALLLAGGGWWFWRSKRSRVFKGPIPPDAMPMAKAGSKEEAAFSDWAKEPEQMAELVESTPIAMAPAADEAHDVSAASIDEIFGMDLADEPAASKKTPAAASADIAFSADDALDMELPAGESPYEKTMKFERPLLTSSLAEDTPASFEVDSGGATNVDFLVDFDEKPAEDRVRRLQYMYERYPELATGTVAIDDADSVINAARLYYEDSVERDAQGKAEELLTFAVEERPQEIRYWLAQFEIYRLERKAAEFSTLAAKFQMLYGHLDHWPKVRHIGHELDPGNPLFAAAERASLAGEPFDAIAENWLNAPTDFASDALAADLRTALFRQHGVGKDDFATITDRLVA